MRVFVQSENFGEEKSVRYQFINSKYQYAAYHVHQFTELVVNFEGDIDISVDNRTETIHPGQAALVFPYQSHTYSSKVKNTLAIFLFSDAMIPEFYNSTNGMVGKSSVFDLSKTALNSFKEKIVDASEFSVYDFKGCAYFALSDFLNQIELCPTSYQSNLPMKMVNYINKHITESFSLSELASELGYSSKYLSNVIKKIFGTNFSTFVANVRVDKARYLLRETDKTITQICYECGFNSERTFHRQFKSITGHTPSEYRARHLNKKLNSGVLYKF